MNKNTPIVYAGIMVALAFFGALVPSIFDFDQSIVSVCVVSGLIVGLIASWIYGSLYIKKYSPQTQLAYKLTMNDLAYQVGEPIPYPEVIHKNRRVRLKHEFDKTCKKTD